MPTLTLSIPSDLKSDMDSMPEMNWSEVARKAISEKVAEYRLFKSIVAKSKLTEKDALEIGRKVSEGMYKAHMKRLQETK